MDGAQGDTGLLGDAPDGGIGQPLAHGSADRRLDQLRPSITHWYPRHSSSVLTQPGANNHIAANGRRAALPSAGGHGRATTAARARRLAPVVLSRRGRRRPSTSAQQRLLGRPVGQRRRAARRPRRPPGGCARGPARMASWPRSSSSASACRASSWRRSASSSSCRRASAGSLEAQRAAAPAGVGTPSRRSVPGVLPDCLGARRRCRSGRRRAGRRRRAARRSRRSSSTVSGGRAAEHRAVAGRGGDEHAGLVGEHPEVVVDRVGALGAGRSSRICPGAQPHEGLRLDQDGLGAEVGDDLGGLAEEQVADQDRRGVAVARRWRWATPRRTSASSMTSSW